MKKHLNKEIIVIGFKDFFFSCLEHCNVNLFFEHF